MVEVATFTPRAPVNLFERARQSLGTTFDTLVAPVLYAEIDASNSVQDLRESSAVLTSVTLTNTSAEPRTVDFQVRSIRRITYRAEVTAAAGQNWLRLDRVTRPTGVSVFGYDWTQTPPVRLSQEPSQIGRITQALAWRPDGRYIVVTADGRRFRIYDRENGYAPVYASDASLAPTFPQATAWSPDGRYLAVSYGRANLSDGVFLRVFDFVAGIDSPVEVAIPDVVSLVTRTPRAIAWGGPGGRYLVAANASTAARFTVWDWGTGAPVYSPSITSALTNATAGGGRAAVFSPDPANPRLAVSHTGGDRLTVFEWADPTTPAKIDDPIFESNTGSTPFGRGLAWSQDGTRLAVLSAASPVTPFTVYNFFGGLSVLPAPASLPPLPELRSLAWSPDNRFLVIGHSGASRYTYYPVPLPYLLLYDYQSGLPVRVTSAPRLQGFGSINGIDFSPGGEVLMVAGWANDNFYPPTGVDNVRLLDANGENVVVNGSFENTDGMTRTPFGFTAEGEIVGWFTDQEPREAVTLFFPDRRFVNAFATNGSVYLDMVASGPQPTPANDARLRQNFDSLTEGETYRLSLDVTASLDSSIAVQVLWNGDPVDIGGDTTTPIIEDSRLVSVVVPPGETVKAPLDRAMLVYGDNLQARASGAGVSAVLSYILSTQDAVDTITIPPEPVDPEEDDSE